MTRRPFSAKLLLIALVAAGCTSHTAFSPQPMQLRLDVIERSLASVEARALARTGGGVADPQATELRRALRACYDAVGEARTAVKARERGDGRAVDEKIRALRRRVETLDGVLASGGISAPPGLDVLATNEDHQPDAGTDGP